MEIAVVQSAWIGRMGFWSKIMDRFYDELAGEHYMEPRNLTTKEIFQGDNVYVVPRYQRLYVWNEQDQWSPLWEDVTQIADDLVEHAKRRGLSAIDTDASESHFFGTLVLKTSGYTPDLTRKWRVIDGQQRLTTMQLMMSAVAGHLTDHGLHEQATPMIRLITNDPQVKSFSPQKVKITHGSDHYDGFVEAMDPCAEKEQISGSMGDCYRFYSHSTRTWFKHRDVSEAILAAALTTAIIVKLRVVGIYLDAHEEEHKIFEALNARGEPLTEWDKIKNFMLHKADDQPSVNQDEFFDRYLDTFDQDWWREEVGRGVGIRPRSDVFADYWLESKTAKAVGARRVFREFQNYINKRPGSLIDAGKELIKDAEYFKTYGQRQVPETSAERRFHNRRLSINIGAWWPLILELNRVFDELDCDDKVRAECFRHLESFLVRRVVVGRQARSYDQVGFEVLNDIRSEWVDRNNLGDVVRRRFIRYTRAGNIWPDDAAVHHAVMSREMPRNVRKLVLEAIETCLIPQNAGYQAFASGLEVEHLMPLGWKSEDWPMDEGDYDESEANLPRDDLIQTLGNLTLINGGLNKQLSNRSWRNKRELIAKSDNLFMNKKLLEDAPERWDEAQIKRRGHWMADMVCKIWPRPANTT